MTPDHTDRPREGMEPRSEGSGAPVPEGLPDGRPPEAPVGPSSLHPPYSPASAGDVAGRAPWDVDEGWDGQGAGSAWGAAEARAAEEARREAGAAWTAEAGPGEADRAVAEARAIRSLEASRGQHGAEGVASAGAVTGGPSAFPPAGPAASDVGREPIVDPELAALARGEAAPSGTAPRRVADIGMLDGAGAAWRQGAGGPASAVRGPVPAAAEPSVAPVARGTLITGPIAAAAEGYPVEGDRGRGRRAAGALLWFGVFVLVVAGAGVLGYGLSQYVAQSMAAASPRPTATPTAAAVTPSPSVAATPGATATGTPASPSASAPATARPSSAAPSPSRSPRIHVVKRGENLTVIARMYDVTVEAIIEANDLDDPNEIEVGQELIIPFPDEG